MPLGAARFGLLGGVADLGKLELIETQTISTSVASVDFTSIDGSNYDVHFLTIDNLSSQLYESGTLETASVYQYAQQYGTASGSSGEQKSTGTSTPVISIQAGNTTNFTTNGYLYYYNLNNSSKYSFSTFHITQMASGGFGASYGFGSFVLPQASTVDGIRIRSGNTANMTQGTLSLYGIAES